MEAPSTPYPHGRSPGIRGPSSPKRSVYRGRPGARGRPLSVDRYRAPARGRPQLRVGIGRRRAVAVAAAEAFEDGGSYTASPPLVPSAVWWQVICATGRLLVIWFIWTALHSLLRALISQIGWGTDWTIRGAAEGALPQICALWLGSGCSLSSSSPHLPRSPPRSTCEQVNGCAEDEFLTQREFLLQSPKFIG